MTDRQKDQRFIENLRANNLRAVEAGGCAPPVYTTAAPAAQVQQAKCTRWRCVHCRRVGVNAGRPSRCHGCKNDTMVPEEFAHPAAGDKVRELLAAGIDELIRRKLTSHPHKFAFAKERGLNGLVEVHAWMTSVADRFESALEAALAQPQEVE